MVEIRNSGDLLAVRGTIMRDAGSQPSAGGLEHGLAPLVIASNHLYHRAKEYRFREVSAGSRLGAVVSGAGVATGDVNSDGCPVAVIEGGCAASLWRRHPRLLGGGWITAAKSAKSDFRPL